ncbi:uncharacterized protein LOC103792246 isoform X2 [Callithrix jacchus]
MALNYGCAFAHFDCFAIFFLTFQKLLWIESTILLIPLIMIHCQKKSHRCPPYCWTAVSLLWIILPEASFTSFGHLESLDISDRGSEEETETHAQKLVCCYPQETFPKAEAVVA